MQITSCPKVTFTSRQQHTSVEAVLEQIRSDQHKASIEAVRSITLTKPERNKLKNNLPAIYFNGTFEPDVNITNKSFKASSGVFHCDVDGLSSAVLNEAYERLRTHPAVLFCFISPSGNGLKYGFKHDPALVKSDDDFKKLFAWFEDYNSQQFKLTIDSSCKNVSRACYMSHDPDAYFNPDAEQIAVDLSQIVLSSGNDKRVKKTDSVQLAPYFEFEVKADATHQDRLFARCVNILKRASDGKRHYLRRDAFRLFGGFVAGGQLDVSRFDELLKFAHAIADGGQMPDKELNTCHEAYSDGFNAPIYPRIKPKPSEPSCDVKTAQNELKKAIGRAFEQGGVIRAPAGLGKTFAVLEQIEQELKKSVEFMGQGINQRKIFFYVPTHKLSDDLMHRINKDFPFLSDKVFVKKGRNADNCQRYEEIESFRNITGEYSVKDSFCNSKQGQCPFFEQCMYQKGLIAEQEAQLVIMSHKYLTIGSKIKPDIMIIDESFWREFAGHDPFEVSKLLDDGVLDAGQLMQLIDILKGFYESGKGAHMHGQLNRAGLVEPLTKYVEGINTVCKGSKVHPNDDIKTIEKKASVLALKRNETYRLAKKLLDKEITFQVYKPEGTEITFFSKKLHLETNNIFNKMKEEGRPIVAIDADADLIISRRLFGWDQAPNNDLDKFTEIDVERNLNILQVQKSFSQWALTDKTDGKPLRSNICEEINDFTKETFAKNGQKTLVVAGKQIEETDEFKSLAENPLIEITHFGALRGVDCWKGFNICIVGRYQPPEETLINMTDALFSTYGDDPGRFFFEHSVGSFESEDVKDHDGKWIGTARFFNNCTNRFKDVANAYNVVLQQIRESETSQAIARCRDIHSEHPIEVLLFDETPLMDIQANDFTTWPELRMNESKRLLKEFYDKHGFLIKSPTVLEKITDTKASKWKRAFESIDDSNIQSIADWGKLEHKTLINIYIGNCASVYEINIQTNSNLLKLWTDESRTPASTLTAQLSVFLGKKVTIIRQINEVENMAVPENTSNETVEAQPEQPPANIQASNQPLEPFTLDDDNPFDAFESDEHFESYCDLMRFTSRVTGIPLHHLTVPAFAEEFEESRAKPKTRNILDDLVPTI